MILSLPSLDQNNCDPDVLSLLTQIIIIRKPKRDIMYVLTYFIQRSMLNTKSA